MGSMHGVGTPFAAATLLCGQLNTPVRPSNDIPVSDIFPVYDMEVHYTQ